MTEIELKLTADPPMFLRVTVWSALVVLTTTFPKFTEVAETVVCARATAEKSRLKAGIHAIAARHDLRKELHPLFDIVRSPLSKWVLPAERRKEQGLAAPKEC